MTVTIASFSFLLAAVCAALMGYAIQRGATCTVAAVGEIVRDGTTKRLVALAETSLWVAGGLLVARALGLLSALPGGFELSGWTVLGGAVLGIGAWINRACVFGAIANLGSGNIAYVATPLGFYLGVVTASTLFGAMMPLASPTIAANSSLPFWAAPVFAVYALWRIVRIALSPHPEGRRWRHVWAPHEATILIGITFVIMLVAVGAWAYTDLLANLAHGMADSLAWRGLLFVALLVGAGLGGWTGGDLAWRWPTLSAMMRCLAGGTLMGWGSALIPGGNDGLILIGMPLLWPYAWVAIFAMCAAIWAAMTIERRIARG